MIRGNPASPAVAMGHGPGPWHGVALYDRVANSGRARPPRACMEFVTRLSPFSLYDYLPSL